MLKRARIILFCFLVTCLPAAGAEQFVVIRGSDPPASLQGATLVWTNAKHGLAMYKTPSHKAAMAAVASAGLEQVPCFRSRTENWVIPTDLVVVQFKKDVPLEQAEQFFAHRNATIVRQRHANQFVVRVPQFGGSPAAAGDFQNSPLVKWAHPNCIREPRRRFLPNDPLLLDQWSIHNTGQNGGANNRDVYAETAWNVTRGTSSVVIAVLDDGCQISHPDLAGNVFVNAGEYGSNKETNSVDDDLNGYVDDWRGWDFVHDDNDPSPVTSYDRHGTATLGLMCAVADNNIGIAGLAHGCRFLPIRIVSTNGIEDIDMADGIDYAAAHADVISIGYFMNPNPIVYDALRRATTQGRSGLGCVVCTALGNDGIFRRSDSDAAAAAEVITVSGTSNYDRRSAHSDYGPVVDLAAPAGGGSMQPVTTDRTGTDGYENGDYTLDSFTGTSAACPLAAAAAALLITQYPDLTGLEIRQRLERSCDMIDSAAHPYDDNNRNDQYGHGRLNVFAALTASAPDWDTFEPDDTPDTAATIADGELQYRSLSAESDVDWAAISLATQADIRISVLATTNTFLELYDSTTNLVASDEAGFPSWSFMTVSNLAAGQYFVRAAVSNAASVPRYGLHFAQLNMFDQYEEDNSTNTASTLPPRTIQYRTLYPTGDVDWARFSIVTNTKVSITTTGEWNGWLELALWAEDGTRLAYYYTQDVQTVISTQLAAGAYFVQVKDIEDYALPSYELLLELDEPDAYEPGDNTTNLASIITPGDRIVRTLYPAGDADWFVFTVSNRANALILTDTPNPLLIPTESDGDTVLWLYDNGGTMLARNDDGNNRRFSAIYETDLDPGTYFIKVAGFTNDTVCANYVVALDLSERSVFIECPEQAIDGIRMMWLGDASFTYGIEYASNVLGTQIWSRATNVEGRTGWNAWTDDGTATVPNPDDAQRRFYRLVVE